MTEDPRKMIPVYVLVSGEASEPDDEGVQGIYLVEVEEDLSPEEMRETALDLFHEDNGIECLDDFAIDTCLGNGNTLPEKEDHVNGSLIWYGVCHGKIYQDDTPKEVLAAYAAQQESFPNCEPN